MCVCVNLPYSLFDSKWWHGRGWAAGQMAKRTRVIGVRLCGKCLWFIIMIMRLFRKSTNAKNMERVTMFLGANWKDWNIRFDLIASSLRRVEELVVFEAWFPLHSTAISIRWSFIKWIEPLRSGKITSLSFSNRKFWDRFVLVCVCVCVCAVVWLVWCGVVLLLNWPFILYSHWWSLIHIVYINIFAEMDEFITFAWRRRIIIIAFVVVAAYSFLIRAKVSVNYDKSMSTWEINSSEETMWSARGRERKKEKRMQHKNKSRYRSKINDYFPFV